MAQKKNLDVIISVRYDGKDADIRINNTKASLQQLNSTVKNMNTNMKDANLATGAASATVLELGRAVSDSNYGIRGMANNLSQLATNFIYTTKSAGTLLGGLKDIGRALMGPLGIILLFQGAIAALERWSMASKDAEEASDDLSDSLRQEMNILRLYEATLRDVNTSLEERTAIVRGLSALDKNLAKQLKEAGNDQQKLADITENFIQQKELELEIKEKEKKLNEAIIETNKALDYQQGLTLIKLGSREAQTLGLNTQQKINEYNTSLQTEAQRKLNVATGEQNKILDELVNLYLKLNPEEEKRKKRKEEEPEDIDFGDTGGVFWTAEDYDTAMQLDIEQRRRYIESRRLFYDDLKIQASEANNDILRDEIQHREDMLVGLEEGSIKRLEAEHEIAMMRMDLQDQEFEHEMLLLDLRMQAQLEYVDFVSGLGQVFTTLGKESEALAKVGLIVQKGAAIAGVVIETQSANQKILAASVEEVGFYKAAAAATALIPAASEYYTGKALDAKAGAAKRISTNNIGAGIAIANILATTLTSRTAPSGGGRAGGGEGGGGRTFDFNLVGSTGTNQLAEAVGAQFQEPIQAYVVSSQITSQQELDLQIETGASLGD